MGTADMLYTASFYRAKTTGSVQRYRISRAHPRGRKTEWEVQPSLYPSRSLLTDYRQGNLTFQQLDVRYREELDETYEGDGNFRAFLEQLPAVGNFTSAVLRACRGTLPPPLCWSAAWLLERVPGLALGRLR